jgi:hypothetical protein
VEVANLGWSVKFGVELFSERQFGDRSDTRIRPHYQIYRTVLTD